MEPYEPFRWVNTELSVQFRKANTDPSEQFRKANTDPSMQLKLAQPLIVLVKSFICSVYFEYNRQFTMPCYAMLCHVLSCHVLCHVPCAIQRHLARKLKAPQTPPVKDTGICRGSADS